MEEDGCFPFDEPGIVTHQCQRMFCDGGIKLPSFVVVLVYQQAAIVGIGMIVGDEQINSMSCIVNASCCVDARTDYKNQVGNVKVVPLRNFTSGRIDKIFFLDVVCV